MAQITRFKNDNRNIRIVTQQYEIGLYVAVYDNDSDTFLDQFSINMPEEEYHRILRKKFKDTLLTD